MLVLILLNPKTNRVHILYKISVFVAFLSLDLNTSALKSRALELLQRPKSSAAIIQSVVPPRCFNGQLKVPLYPALWTWQVKVQLAF
jgi:hypothetical protein